MTSSSVPITDPSDVSGRPRGQILAFVSAKGGTGKTVIAATAAYLLLKAGWRVLTIDSDFSTRGLSLYLLGKTLDSSDLTILPNNCLAEALFGGIDVKQLMPREIVRDNLPFHALLPNQKFERGGVPDDRLLGGAAGGSQVAANGDAYFRFLRDVCERFREEYDFIIIDTRGGYDFTSAAAAVNADGYIVIVEADGISIDQVGGLKQLIEEHGAAHAVEPTLKGFIINKALFSVDDAIFPDQLRRLYQTRTFGVIPTDRDAIRAYQKKRIPLEETRDSDFCYFSLRAFDKLFAPADNHWPRPNVEKFDKFAGVVRQEWAAQRYVKSTLTLLPFGHVALLVAAAFSYLLYRNGWSAFSLTIFYALLGAAVLGAGLSSALSMLSILKETLGRQARLALSGGLAVGLLLLGYMIVADMPKTFSQNTLLNRVREQDALIAQNAGDLEAAKKESDDLRARVDVAVADATRANAAAVAATAERDRLAAQLDDSRMQQQELAARLAQIKDGRDPAAFGSPIRLTVVMGRSCNVLMLTNSSSASAVSMYGWRLEATSARAKAFAELVRFEAAPRPGSAIGLLSGDCEPILQSQVLGVSYDLAAVANVKGDAFGPFPPGNDGEIRLIDRSGVVRDTVPYSRSVGRLR